jgi:single-strand DNA-binding protein
MAKGINKAILMGHLGGDPVVRYMPNGKAACSFSLATGESWKNKQTGEPEERTEWHKIVVFNRLAEVCGEFLKKGSKVYLEGKISTRKWQNKEKQDVYTTEIICDEMIMLDGKNDGAQFNKPQQDNFMPPSSSQGNKEGPYDDDIPF